MSSTNGIEDAKLLAVHEYATSPDYGEDERLVLEYADRITLSSQDVDDELFARLGERFTPAEIVELTFTIGYENMLSKLHHALLVEAHGFCAIPPERLAPRP